MADKYVIELMLNQLCNSLTIPITHDISCVRPTRHTLLLCDTVKHSITLVFLKAESLITMAAWVIETWEVVTDVCWSVGWVVTRDMLWQTGWRDQCATRRVMNGQARRLGNFRIGPSFSNRNGQLEGAQTVGRKTSWAKDVWTNYFSGDRQLSDKLGRYGDSKLDGWATLFRRLGEMCERGETQN